MDLIYDMEDTAPFSQLYDEVQVLSNQPNANFMVNSQVINTIMPSGLQGEIFQNSGDYFSYCISTDKQRQMGELVFKPDTCQIKYKMRVMAAPNKLPGFFKISGYEQVVKHGPAMLMTRAQMAHIVDRISETFPALGEVRKKVIMENEPSSYGLLKDNLMVKVLPDTTRD